MMSDLKQTLLDIGQKVEPYIEELLADSLEPSTVEQAIYQCKIGGKRLRPCLVVLVGQLFGADFKDLVYPAAAIEILHNSTLLADDIIDHSDFRRNQPTCWKKYGQSFAECQILNYGAAIPIGLVKSSQARPLIELYSRTLKTVVEGEIKDILFERSDRDNEPYAVANRYQTITKDDYFAMIRQKTAILIEACCRAGAIIAGASQEQTERIASYGNNIGLAFQIQDDILDIFADEAEFGKKVGKDIIEKKLGNFVILSALEELGQVDQACIKDILNSGEEVTDGAVQKVIGLINKTKAKQIAEAVAKSYITKALSDLAELPQNNNNQLLVDLANYIVARQS